MRRAALVALLLAAAPGAAGQPGLRLADVAWPAAEKWLAPERVVVLPLGAAAKEHGPHLPLAADFIEAEHLPPRSPLESTLAP